MLNLKEKLNKFFIVSMVLSCAACSGNNANLDDAGKSSKSKEVASYQAEKVDEKTKKVSNVLRKRDRADDELVVSMGPRLPHEFDPKKRWGMYNEAHITHSTLLRKTADLKVIGDFAKDYNISEDGLIWSFNLHDNFKFSNGESVTAEDVKFSYEMLMDFGQHWDLAFVDKIQIPKKNQIVFYLKEPRSTFTAQLTEVPIVPKAHYNDNYTSNPIGSGPYLVKEYVPGEQAIFEVNPHWHGKKPHFKKWTWVLLDENTALAALKAGEVDLVYVVPEFADEKIEGCKLFEIESNDVRGLSLPYQKKGVITDSPDGYPVGNDVTSDPFIRKALNIGLNRQRVVEVALNGHGMPAYSVVDKMPWWNPATAIKDNRVEEAKELLESNGWILKEDNIREKDGLKAEFDLYYPTADQLRANVAIEAAGQAEALGIKINLVGSNWDEIKTVTHQVALLYAGGRNHPNQFYTSHNPEMAGHGWMNVTFYDNPKVLDYMNKAMRSTDLDKANEYWKKAQWDGEVGASTLGDLPNVWLVRFNHTYLGDKRIDIGNQGVHSHGHDWAVLHNIYDWKWSNN